MRASAPILVVVVVGALLAAPAGGAVGDARQTASAPAIAADNATETPVQHRNPEERQRGGDLEDLRDALAAEMGETLVDCTDGVNIGSYDACDRLDEDYPEILERYVDVVQETEDDDDDDSGESFERARQQQKNYTERVREFREKLEEYARELARELQRLAADIRGVSLELVDSYEEVERSSGTDTDAATEAVNETRENVTETTVRIRRATFEPSTVTARADSDRASFRDPLVIEGRVTGNGTGLVGRTVAIDTAQTATNTTRMTTGPNGSYRFVYRPTTAPAGETELTVRWVPDDTDRYLGANATLTTTVEQVGPTLSLRSSGEGAFGELVQARGRVSADGTGAAGVPVVVTVDGDSIGRARTDWDGRYRVRGRIPASVRAGNRTVEARLLLNDQALRSTRAAGAMEIAETDTALSVSAERRGDMSILARGRLVTDDGRPVPGQSVAIDVEQGGRRTTTTDGDGRYRVVLLTSPEARDDAPVTVRAGYAATDTNLRPSEASTTVVFDASDDGTRPMSYAPWVVGGAVGLVVAGLVLWVRRRSGSDDTAEPTTPAAGTNTDDTVERPDASESIARARKLLDEGDVGAAVRTGYAAARRHFETDGSKAMTHWEFHRAVAARLDGERGAALRRLTEGYEAAVFAPDGASSDDASDAVAAAERLLDDVRADGDGGEKQESGDRQ
jgi:hypothetical protein